MTSRHVLRFLVCLGWFGSYQPNLQAQEFPRLPIPAATEETTRSPSLPPTPQFIQVEVDFGPPGPSWRLHRHPSWATLYRPRVQVRQSQTAPASTTETAPPFEGGPEQLYQALEQALNRVQTPEMP